MSDASKTPGRDRRAFLKSGAALAVGAVAGARITGFPFISGARAQEAKTLRYLGTAVNQSKRIAEKVKEDLGITIEYVPVTTDEVTKRIITQPNTFDIVDTEYFSLKKFVPTGNLMGMDAKRITEFDNIGLPPEKWSSVK